MKTPEKITCPMCHNEWYEWHHTPEEKAKPVSPEKCSKCGKDDIQTIEPPLFESDDRISVIMQCQDCGHKWHEYFDLTDVVEEDD